MLLLREISCALKKKTLRSNGRRGQKKKISQGNQLVGAWLNTPRVYVRLVGKEDVAKLLDAEGVLRKQKLVSRGMASLVSIAKNFVGMLCSWLRGG